MAPTNNLPILTEEKVIVPKRYYTYADLLAMTIDTVPTLFYPTIIKQGIAICYGAPDCGKSMFLRQMCAHVATGRDFMGFKYQGTRHKSIYFSSEDDANITAPVIKRNDKALQLSAEAAQNMRFVFDYTADGLPEMLREMLTEQAADLVIIDAFGDAFNGKSSNDTNEVRSFYKQFTAISKEFECVIIFNHHVSKSALKYAPGKETALGSEAIVSAPRLGMEIRRDPRNSDIVHLCFTKGNYMGMDYKKSSYAMTMDAESLTFTPTGNRVPFEDLAKRDGVTYEERQSKKAESMDMERFRNALLKIFANETHRNQTHIRKELCAEFGISDKTARKYIEHCVSNGWMKADGKSGLSILYKCTIK